MSSPALRTVATAELTPADLAAAHALFASAFGPDADATDWDHCLGGVHVMLHDADELIGHAAVVPRRLFHRGRTLRTGYLEGVAVAARHRGRGHGGELVAEAERLIRDGYELGALSSTTAALPFYAKRGWLRWEGTTAVLTPHGAERTPDDDDGVFVLPVGVRLEPQGRLVCDARAGDPW
ncbi:GNAT family N-acetyltransferase [Streptomyces spiramenti]|uniref:GNAT family N-acetyltransferase n=1 Tax=Streptomyces spiramenti TaxID=2720606 RepID=A0ABX1AE36_9ACTN|nr:GNAT family N-acetyltransferase [Streptomyces spiramenti]NJP65399.1 GNAT family N-acetyltransferase [Streptomyces spiramenti]